MKMNSKPLPKPQRGYIVAWACLFIASTSLALYWTGSSQNLRNQSKAIAANAEQLRSQISKIQNDLARCANQLQSNNGSTFTYPPTPSNNRLQDVTCSDGTQQAPRLWSEKEWIRLKPAKGFSDWTYRSDVASFSIRIASTDGNTSSIATLNRVYKYVLPQDAERWQNNSDPSATAPTWLGDRANLSNTADGRDSQLEISSRQ
jgi:hypothetical protein